MLLGRAPTHHRPLLVALGSLLALLIALTADDRDQSTAVVLGDVNGDGHLDVIVANCLQPNKLYLNNGTSDPFAGVAGQDISTDMDTTRALALGDVDGDGDLDWDRDLDIVTANRWQLNTLYLNEGTAGSLTHLGPGAAGLYHTARGRAASLRVNAEITGIPNATLPANTGVTWWLSNNGGGHWFLVRPGTRFEFPTAGTDLRWRSELGSLSPILTPWVDELQIGRESYPFFLPLISSEGDTALDRPR